MSGPGVRPYWTERDRIEDLGGLVEVLQIEIMGAYWRLQTERLLNNRLLLPGQQRIVITAKAELLRLLEIRAAGYGRTAWWKKWRDHLAM